VGGFENTQQMLLFLVISHGSKWHNNTTTHATTQHNNTAIQQYNNTYNTPRNEIGGRSLYVISAVYQNIPEVVYMYPVLD